MRYAARPAGGIFAAGGFPAPQVALLLIAVQHHPYLPVQRVIKQRQPLLDILMHRGFGDVELLCGLPHGGACFDDITGELHRPILRQPLHDEMTSPQLVSRGFLVHLYAAGAGGMLFGLLQRQGIGRQPGSFALSPPRNAPAPCAKAKNLLYYNEFAPKGRKW